MRPSDPGAITPRLAIGAARWQHDYPTLTENLSSRQTSLFRNLLCMEGKKSKHLFQSIGRGTSASGLFVRLQCNVHYCDLPSWSQSSLHLSVIGVPCDFHRMSLGSDRNCSVMRVSMRAPFESRTRSISRTWKNVKRKGRRLTEVSALCQRILQKGPCTYDVRTEGGRGKGSRIAKFCGRIRLIGCVKCGQGGGGCPKPPKFCGRHVHGP